MTTVLLYTFFAISVALSFLGAIYFIRACRGIVVLGGNSMPTPMWLHVFVFCFGCLGVLSSAPSIFSNNPHWFSDKIYFVVSKIVAAFA